MKLNNTLKALAVVVLALGVAIPRGFAAFDPVGEDIDIFLANPSFTAQRPNVLWWDSFVIGAGPVAEQLVAGRERNFYGRIYASSAGAIDQHEAERLAADYGRPGRTHAGFEYFRQQDVGEKAVDDLLIRDGKLTIPVLGAGGELSMGGLVGAKLPRVATTVSSAVIPGSHHWVLDEQPAAVAGLLNGFFR